ncbi:MAG: hypothetical protein FJ217_14460 [Ignavibacteria bacterium]|nr:hypothetical protein [Ignavibacteria bacterium]
MQTRRAFLRNTGFAAASLLLADRILARPYAPISILEPAVDPVRIRGRVHSTGGGLSGVRVSDGLSVVRTQADGTFELMSNTRQEFVFVSLPRGYNIPTNPTGTALFYQPLQPDRNGEATAQFNLAKLPTADDRHAFFLLADPQMLDEEDVQRFHAETVVDVFSFSRQLSEQPLFGVACGDIMFDRLQYFPDYERGVKAMATPFFQVMGNHDVEVQAKTDETSAATFRKFFGPTYYSFDRGEIHYVVMDNIFWFGRYIGYLDQVQLDWLKADLSFVEEGKTVVVFMHIPLYNQRHIREGKRTPENAVVVTNRELLYRLLEPYKAYVICGHMHESEYLTDGGAEIHVCGAVCGAWWSGPICYDGTPNGYSVYEVKGGELTWRYKPTGVDIDRQMRLYPRGADPRFPDELVANVWSADSSWKVIWSEDGIRKGAMDRRIGKDPLSVTLHDGPDLPKKHRWVDPVPTDHLFYAKPSPGAHDVAVEATDRWGRVYKGTIALE